jgi:hypothetical protein
MQSGGGSGGRIVLVSSVESPLPLQVFAGGGGSGSTAGAAGTVFHQTISDDVLDAGKIPFVTNVLLVDNNGSDTAAATSLLTLRTDDEVIDQILMTGKAQARVDAGNILQTKTITRYSSSPLLQLLFCLHVSLQL